MDEELRQVLLKMAETSKKLNEQQGEVTVILTLIAADLANLERRIEVLEALKPTSGRMDPNLLN